MLVKKVVGRLTGFGLAALVLGGCTVPNQKIGEANFSQVARTGSIGIHKPAYKSIADEKQDHEVCVRGAGDDVHRYVACMAAQGYGVEFFDDAGRRIDLAQIPRRPSPYLTSSAVAARPAPPPSNKYAELLDQLVAQDSRSWLSNRYRAGSMRNAQIVSADGDTATVRGTFSYDDGRDGWVEMRLAGGSASCVRYWDFADQCRPIGLGYGSQVAAAMMLAVVADMASPRSGSAAPAPAAEPEKSSATRIMEGLIVDELWNP